MIKTMVNITIVCLLAIIAKQSYECKKMYEGLLKKPIVEATGFYRCAGTKKNPKWCSIQVYREIKDAN